MRRAYDFPRDPLLLDRRGGWCGLAADIPFCSEGEFMNYAVIKDCDIANGPGVRVSLFVSGCTHHCKGCFNEVAWDFDYGQPFTEDTVEKILNMMAPGYIKGITLLGGEPFEPQNQPALVDLAKRIKAKYPTKSIWAFSGYLFENMLDGKVGDRDICMEFLKHVDVLVDGPFVESKKNLMLRFRGSENQRIIDVQTSLKTGEVVFWEDWQGERK